MILFQKALSALLEKTAVRESFETVSLLASLHRVSYEDINALIDIPSFDTSPLDGYALRYEDILNMDKVTLKVIETIYAGDFPKKTLAEKECARIMTGAPIPKGATCVVRYEDTDMTDDTYIAIRTNGGVERNIINKGEDISYGQKLIGKGERISPFHISLLATQGLSDIFVFTRPKVGILSSGNELESCGEPLKNGKIYDSNKYLLGAKTLALYAEPIFIEKVEDNPDKIAENLEELLETCDFIVTTGGVSVGERDYMPSAGKIIGAEEIFRFVNIKPGGRITAFSKNRKIILCLSGNPKAASVTFDLFAAPVIQRLSGIADYLPKRTQSVLSEAFPKTSDTRRFIYAKHDGKTVSKISANFAETPESNVIIDIPEKTPPLSAGDNVEIILL